MLNFVESIRLNCDSHQDLSLRSLVTSGTVPLKWAPAMKRTLPQRRTFAALEGGKATGIRCCFTVVHVCPYSFVCSELCASWKTNSVIYNDINIYIYIYILHNIYIYTLFLYARHVIWIDVTYLPNCFFFPRVIRLIRSSLSSLTWHVQQDPPSTKVLHEHMIASYSSPG